MFAGTGSQTGTNGRWGDYSDMTVDPVDDCTFWYTQEYYADHGQFRLAHAHRLVQVSRVVVERQLRRHANADSATNTNSDTGRANQPDGDGCFQQPDQSGLDGQCQ